MQGPEPASVIPPAWFVENFNREPTALGLPYRTALDPLVMLMWEMTHAPSSVPPFPVTSI